VTPEELAQLVIGIAGPGLGAHGENFVHTLAANRRLAYLPEIAQLFDEFDRNARVNGAQDKG